MEIKFLKAGKGDAILIQYNRHNILIDGGDDYTYLRQELIDILKKDECLDLVIVTHHDEDHIAGIIELVKEVKEGVYGESLDFIKKIIFNSPKAIITAIKAPDYLSYKQAKCLNDLLTCIKCEHVIGYQGLPSLQYGALEIDIIAPFEEELKNYAQNTKALLAGGRNCDWNNSLKELEPYCDDNSLDSSPSNRTSIVCIIRFENKQILLSGDTTPDILTIALNDWALNHSLKFDLMKLPHHGSYRNISNQLLDLIDCNKYVIMTNGKNSCLPDKKAFLKILKWRKSKNTEFYFNYNEVISSLNFPLEELKTFNFSLHTPNNSNGYYY